MPTAALTRAQQLPAVSALLEGTLAAAADTHEHHRRAMTVVYRHPKTTPGVSVMIGKDDQTHWKVLHRHYEIVMGYAGYSVARCRYRYWDLPPNTLSVLHPDLVHENVRVPAPTTYDVLLVDPAYALDLLPDVPDENRLRVAAGVYQASPQMRALCRRTQALIAEDADPLGIQEAVADVFHAIVDLSGEPEVRARARPERRPDPRWVARAVDYLEEHYADRVTLKRLAEVAGCDQFRLLRAFRACREIAPHEYQTRLRVLEARRRLAAGAPIAELAAELGFADQSHFTRTFKGVTAVTPGEYARGARPKEPPARNR